MDAGDTVLQPNWALTSTAFQLRLDRVFLSPTAGFLERAHRFERGRVVRASPQPAAPLDDAVEGGAPNEWRRELLAVRAVASLYLNERRVFNPVLSDLGHVEIYFRRRRRRRRGDDCVVRDVRNNHDGGNGHSDGYGDDDVKKSCHQLHHRHQHSSEQHAAGAPHHPLTRPAGGRVGRRRRRGVSIRPAACYIAHFSSVLSFPLTIADLTLDAQVRLCVTCADLGTVLGHASLYLFSSTGILRQGRWLLPFGLEQAIGTVGKARTKDRVMCRSANSSSSSSSPFISSASSLQLFAKSLHRSSGLRQNEDRGLDRGRESSSHRRGRMSNSGGTAPMLSDSGSDDFSGSASRTARSSATGTSKQQRRRATRRHSARTLLLHLLGTGGRAGGSGRGGENGRAGWSGRVRGSGRAAGSGCAEGIGRAMGSGRAAGLSSLKNSDGEKTVVAQKNAGTRVGARCPLSANLAELSRQRSSELSSELSSERSSQRSSMCVSSSEGVLLASLSSASLNSWGGAPGAEWLSSSSCGSFQMIEETTQTSEDGQQRFRLRVRDHSAATRHTGGRRGAQSSICRASRAGRHRDEVRRQVFCAMTLEEVSRVALRATHAYKLLDLMQRGCLSKDGDAVRRVQLQCEGALARCLTYFGFIAVSVPVLPTPVRFTAPGALGAVERASWRAASSKDITSDADTSSGSSSNNASSSSSSSVVVRGYRESSRRDPRRAISRRELNRLLGRSSDWFLEVSNPASWEERARLLGAARELAVAARGSSFPSAIRRSFQLVTQRSSSVPGVYHSLPNSWASHVARPASGQLVQRRALARQQGQGGLQQLSSLWSPLLPPRRSLDGLAPLRREGEAAQLRGKSFSPEAELRAVEAALGRSNLTAAEKKLIWRYRAVLRDKGICILKLAESVDFSNEKEASEFAALVESWPQLPIEGCLRLLSALSGRPVVRALAYRGLEAASHRDVRRFLPQLVQAIRYEGGGGGGPGAEAAVAGGEATEAPTGRRPDAAPAPPDAAPLGSSGAAPPPPRCLVDLLLRRATECPRIAAALFWGLQCEMEDPEKAHLFIRAHQRLFEALSSAPSGSRERRTLQILLLQRKLVGALRGLASKIRNRKDRASRKTERLRELFSGDVAAGRLGGNIGPPDLEGSRCLAAENTGAQSSGIDSKGVDSSSNGGGQDGGRANDGGGSDGGSSGRGSRNNGNGTLCLSRLQPPVPMPISPYGLLLGIVAEQSHVMRSSQYPLVLACRLLVAPPSSGPPGGASSGPLTSGESESLVDALWDDFETDVEELKRRGCVEIMKRYLFKYGDDLRQDQLVTQIIGVTQELLVAYGCDYRMEVYDVLAFSRNDGIVEFVENSEALSTIKKSYPTLRHFFAASAAASSGGPSSSASSAAQTVFPPPPPPLGFPRSVLDTFIRSCSGYSVVTFLLGVGDRHLDNLLLCDDGRFFHVDFGFILGDDPKPFPPPMKLCGELVDGFGGIGSEGYTMFQLLCCQCFRCLRRNSQLLLDILLLMAHSGIRAFRSEPLTVVARVQEKFQLALPEVEAEGFLLDVIAVSANALFPAVFDKFHEWALYWK